MAEIMKWLNANLDYVKVKLSINTVVWPSFLMIELVCNIMVTHSTQSEEFYVGIKSAVCVRTSEAYQSAWSRWVRESIDMLEFTFFM